ncbi:MAG: response regulator transcription factor [Pseudomonadota bacterium]
MRVLMVDDHLMFLQGMRTLLGVLAPDLEVDTARDQQEALQHASMNDYEAVLLDWNLDGCKGHELLAALRDAGCRARVIVVSGETDPRRVGEMFSCGIAGFIPKAYTGEKMLDALNVTFEGRVFIPGELMARIERSDNDGRGLSDKELKARLDELTSRQLDVFRTMARGLPNKLIARELNIGEATVKTHLTAVFAVLGVSNRTQAALYASRVGLHVG